jgi:hypothetical protein
VASRLHCTTRPLDLQLTRAAVSSSARHRWQPGHREADCLVGGWRDPPGCALLHLGHLLGFDQALDRRLGEHDLLDDLVLGDPVDAGLVADLARDRSALSPSTSSTVTLAPVVASRRAQAAPMPLP